MRELINLTLTILALSMGAYLLYAKSDIHGALLAFILAELIDIGYNTRRML